VIVVVNVRLSDKGDRSVLGIDKRVPAGLGLAGLAYLTALGAGNGEAIITRV